MTSTRCQILLAAVIGWWVSSSGCSSVPLPAIDPSGERIFLPSPSYTTVVGPYDSTGIASCLPQSAFPEPAPIPACTTPPPPRPGDLAGTGLRPAMQDRLILSPAKMVAPINSEVVLLAGLCSQEGYLVTKQPVEWMLSPDSVGNIIGLAESSHSHLARLAHHAPTKASNNLATTRTSTQAHVVNRGTSLPDDDIRVGKGQTWISVSSPTEGVSYVTAVAKGVENWETRRQTALIYWVDMQWAFPSPQIRRAGQPAELQTVVTKTSSGNPAAKATVLYEVMGGSPAFLGTGRTAVRVPTDENGRAAVQVFQDPPGPGTTQIRMQVFSGAGADSGSQIVIGQGFTTITWSAPGLAIHVNGPQLLARGAVASYRVEVSNPGDIVARDVALRVELPTAFGYLNSQPSAQVLGNRLEWMLGDLAPRQVQTFQINCQAVNSGEYQLVARAVSPDVTEARGVAVTRVVESGLSLRFVDAPTAAIVGSRVEFNFEISNTGGLPLNNVVVRDTFDAGLEPAYANVDLVRPLELPIGNLAVGETRRHGVAFVVRRPGQLCHTLEASVAGGSPESARACITATQPSLRVDLRKVGPKQARVGESVRFVISITNTGEGVLTNLQIADLPDQNLQADQGTLGLEKVGNTIVWRAGTLGPGQSATREIVCICRAEAAAQNVVEVTADGGVRETAVAQLTILPAPEVRPPPPTPAPGTPPQPPPAGQLGVEVADLGDPFVGGTASLIIVVRNLSNDPDQDVQLTVSLPPELASVTVNPDSLRVAVTPVAGGVAIGPIREIRGLETLPRIRINAAATKAGRYQIKVRAESRRAPPTEAETEINVVAR